MSPLAPLQIVNLQKKLDRLVKLANEVQAEVKSVFPEGGLFFESEGSFHVMDGDVNGSSAQRQQHVVLTSNGHCAMGCGSW